MKMYSLLITEDDNSYRERLCEKIPEGAVYTAEWLSDSSGESLDMFGDEYDCPRFR